ncbi:NAD(P)H-binding protein [Marinicellulosiphila megalodicopiae]|uniref:NAD(P)H-binding protein n=1 Tax=Marinicellulosiphila megalodicopiae TaxID=2724896 RepID=UPI003BB03218
MNNILLLASDNLIGDSCVSFLKKDNFKTTSMALKSVLKYLVNEQGANELASIINQHDVVILLMPMTQTELKDKTGHKQRSIITQAVVDKMRQLKKERLIILTDVGVGESELYQSSLANWLWKKHRPQWLIEEFERQEIILEYSYLEWTVVRPVNIKSSEHNDYECSDLLKTGVFDSVSEQAIAKCIVDQLKTDRYTKRSITVKETLFK